MAYSSGSLEWRGNYLYKKNGVNRKLPILSLRRDLTYPNMWRIKGPKGELSDMLNRTRAIDAGVFMALAHLNGEEK